MSVNSSSNSSDSFNPLLNNCLQSRTTIFIFMCFAIVNTLFSPLFFFIIYFGIQRWRTQSRSTAWTISHSDFFTYNVVGLEVISILGFNVYVSGAYNDNQTLKFVGEAICSITSAGQTLFHVLTCGERYLAVVYPVIYLRLRKVGGLRVRNISTLCVWLLCFGLVGLCNITGSNFGSTTISGGLVCSIILVSFWSFSVLRVLNHRGPGEVCGERERVDQTKQRAFYTIVAILVALLLRIVGILVCNAMFASSVLTHTNCAVGSIALWLTVPCSLVLPVLFLQRAGKLPGYKTNTELG